MKKVLYFIIAITITINSFLGFNTQSQAMERDEVEIRTVIERYMFARKDVLRKEETQGLSDVAVVGIINDELAHKEVLQEANIEIFRTKYKIIDISIDDRESNVSLVETVIYISDGKFETSEVEHDILLMDSKTRGWVVLSDKYYEDISEFASCSYVPQISTYAIQLGNSYSLEIVKVAFNEIGYLEKETNNSLYDATANPGDGNFTKYGAWYGNNGSAWCATFVSWCANKAGISTCIVPKYEGCDDGVTQFTNRGFYVNSPAHGNASFIPQEGDIFFMGVVGDATHTGIVAEVSGSYMYVIHGNTSNSVKMDTYRIDDSSILGFARPMYSLTHLYKEKTDETHHWSECSICGNSTTKVAHNCGDWESSTTYHWKECKLCGTVVQKMKHKYSASGTCTICGRIKMSVAE